MHLRVRYACVSVTICLILVLLLVMDRRKQTFEKHKRIRQFQNDKGVHHLEDQNNAKPFGKNKQIPSADHHKQEQRFDKHQKVPDADDSKQVKPFGNKEQADSFNDKQHGHNKQAVALDNNNKEQRLQYGKEVQPWDSNNQIQPFVNDTRLLAGEPLEGKPFFDQQNLSKKKYHRHDFLKDKKIDFDKRFKNPCWYKGRVLKCLPYFFVIGMRKSATTHLFDMIRDHPEVVDWGKKESQFFGIYQIRQEPGSDDIYTYSSLFDEGARKIQLKSHTESPNTVNKYIMGDGSQCMLYVNYDWRLFPGNENLTEPKIVTLDYIHHFLPDAKIIIVFRDPVDRLYSEYYFTFGKLKHLTYTTPEHFHTVATGLVDLYTDCFKTRSVRQCVYDRTLWSGNKTNPNAAQLHLHMGIYYIYWLELVRVYRREQILVLRTQDLDSVSTLRTIFSFLNMTVYPDDKLKAMIPERLHNSRPKPYKEMGPMMNETRTILKTFYQPFDKLMASLMSDPFFLFN